MGDLSLRDDVISELEYLLGSRATNLGTAVTRGVVTLSGHVDSYLERIAVERAVQGLRGVRALASEIVVRLPNHRRVGDDEIADRAARIIEWSVAMSEGKIRIAVKNGCITLDGTVSTLAQKAAAESAVRQLSGLVAVTNSIRVESAADTNGIESRVRDALQRSAEIDAGDIRVSVAGRTVTLEGQVRSMHNRDVARRAAWAAPGVEAVEDRISIVANR